MPAVAGATLACRACQGGQDMLVGGAKGGPGRKLPKGSMVAFQNAGTELARGQSSASRAVSRFGVEASDLISTEPQRQSLVGVVLGRPALLIGLHEAWNGNNLFWGAKSPR